MDEFISFLIYSQFRSPIFDFFSLIFDIFLSSALILAFLFVYWFVKDDSRGFFAFVGFLFNNMIVFILKLFFMRPRPLYGASDFFYSFPSAHSANAFFLAVIFSYYYPKKRVYAYLLAFFVAFSRVYNGTHYLYDILVGSVLGFFFGIFCLKYKYKFDKLYNYVENN